MSAGDIDELLSLWNALLPEEADPPFISHNDIYSRIDEIKHGDVKWQSMTAAYQPQANLHGDGLPSWMTTTYDVWFQDPRKLLHNQLANRDFDGDFDYSPRQIFNEMNKRVWSDFMTGCWAWDQAVRTQSYCQFWKSFTCSGW
jgi:Plavaka transposase